MQITKNIFTKGLTKMAKFNTLRTVSEKELALVSGGIKIKKETAKKVLKNAGIIAGSLALFAGGVLACLGVQSAKNAYRKYKKNQKALKNQPAYLEEDFGEDFKRMFNAETYETANTASE